MTKTVAELESELEQMRELFLAAVATQVDGSKFARRYEEIQAELTALGHSPY
jgi:hypothetical protein